MKQLTQKRCIVGEGPIWNDREELLYFVNGIDNEICTYDPATDTIKSYPQAVGVAAIAFSKDGRMLVTRADGAFLFLQKMNVVGRSPYLFGKVLS
jgi:sugar lactone lactonase YvrE